MFQRDAHLIEALSCAGNAGVNGDGRMDRTDAALIVLLDAGLLHPGVLLQRRGGVSMIAGGCSRRSWGRL